MLNVPWQKIECVKCNTFWLETGILYCSFWLHILFILLSLLHEMLIQKSYNNADGDISRMGNWTLNGFNGFAEPLDVSLFR